MSTTTNSLVARAKRLAVPAGILATLLFVFAFFIDHNKAMAAASGPLDDTSVSSLVALDNAVEAVAARVTPAVVNVSVTSRVSHDEQGEGDGEDTAADAARTSAASTPRIFHRDSGSSSSDKAGRADRA